MDLADPANLEFTPDDMTAMGRATLDRVVAHIASLPDQHGPDLSRGFPGLRVWLSVKLLGAARFRAAIAEKRQLAVEASARIARIAGVTVVARAVLVCVPSNARRGWTRR